MRYPKHILTDISSSQSSHINEYWANQYLTSCSRDKYYKNTTLNLKDRRKPSKKSIFRKKFSTVSFTTIVPSTNVQLVMQLNPKASTRLWKLFDINFLKREKLYTKLKYSRSPAYDIVSGGVAALFSAFVGFLISEKFGIELVDSGDFYTFFMYMVFLFFSMRPCIKILSKESTLYSFLSPKYLTNYVVTIITLLFRWCHTQMMGRNWRVLSLPLLLALITFLTVLL